MSDRHDTSVPDLTAETGELVAAITSTVLTDSDVDQLERLTFDAVVCALGAAQLPWMRALRTWAASSASTGPAAIVGSDARYPAAVAAMVNGTAIHSYELDDTHDASLSHPASVTVATALAAAMDSSRTTTVTGRDVYAAIAAGYETMARLGRAMNTGEMISRGFHPTALYGTFGAAATAASVYHLSFDGLLGSWGHALSLTGGSMQFSDETSGTAVKRAHAGYAAQAGIQAAQLTQAGLDSPHRSLDGRYGALPLFGTNTHPDRLTEHRECLAIHEISMKPYACCRQFHSAIDALREVTSEFAVPADSIDDLVVRGPAVLGEQHMLRHPQSTMAAQYSLPWTMAATAYYGADDLTAYGQEALGRDDVLALASRVRVELDNEMEQLYPETLGGEVELTTRDGTRIKARVLDSRGTVARPLSWIDLRAKAAALLALSDDGFDIAAVEEAVRTLRNVDERVSELVADVLGGRP